MCTRWKEPNREYLSQIADLLEIQQVVDVLVSYTTSTVAPPPTVFRYGLREAYYHVFVSSPPCQHLLPAGAVMSKGSLLFWLSPFSFVVCMMVAAHGTFFPKGYVDPSTKRFPLRKLRHRRRPGVRPAQLEPSAAGRDLRATTAAGTRSSLKIS